jgi:hypothetical protein
MAQSSLLLRPVLLCVLLLAGVEYLFPFELAMIRHRANSVEYGYAVTGKRQGRAVLYIPVLRSSADIWFSHEPVY